MKLTTRVAAVAAVAGMIGLAPLAAQDSAQPAQESAQAQQDVLTARGELLRVDLETHRFWIKTEAETELQFNFTDETEIVRDGENVEGLATVTGSQVVVEYRAEGSTAVATKIEIRAEEAEAEPDQPMEMPDLPQELPAPEIPQPEQ